MSEKELDNSQQDELSSQFYRSRADVTQFMEWIDQQYTRPALKKTQLSFQKHPVPSVFAAVFTILSIAPVSIYIGLCVFSLALLLLSALSVVILVFFAVASLLGFVLSLILLINLFLSIFFTLSLASAYILYKIVLAGYTAGTSGARHQIIEFYHIFLSGFRAKNYGVGRSSAGSMLSNNAGTSKHHAGSEASSPDSTVIIDNPAFDNAPEA